MKKNLLGSMITTLRKRRPKPVWFLVTSDVLIAVAVLLVFALFHHVIPRERPSAGITSSRAAAVAAPTTQAPESLPTDPLAMSAAEPTAAPEQTETTVGELDPFTQGLYAMPIPGDFSAVFADRFTDGTVEKSADHYRSANLDVTITEHTEPAPNSHTAGMRYFVADFYVRDISCLATAFAQDRYGRNITENIVPLSDRKHTTLALSGDFYGYRAGGVCIRNSTLYFADQAERDICVLFWDGSVRCYTKDEFDADTVMAQGAYQSWCFGPALLDGNGEPRTDYDKVYKDVYGNHPRSLFGYYEPGHYAFIVVEGRTDASRGMTIDQAAAMASRLGLKQCYNLDGGGTAQLTYGTTLLNDLPYNARDCSDYIVLYDRVDSAGNA